MKSEEAMNEITKIISDETRHKISENHIDVSGVNNPFFGKHHTEETKKLLSDGHIGLQAGENNPMHGVHLSGAKHWNWQGGITPRMIMVRASQAYKNWRKQVFKRDDYTCKLCNARGGNIQAHHIHPVRDNKNTLLLLDIDNGIILCEECHLKIRGREYEYVSQFESILQGE